MEEQKGSHQHRHHHHHHHVADELPDASVAASVMLKVPTSNLTSLKRGFEKVSDGLDLELFLKVFAENMDLENDEDLAEMVPNLVDFFNFVDINGDGRMEWSEFVMFIIEQVIKDESTIYERFANVCHRPIQEAASHHAVHCCKFIPELNKLFVGVGNKLQIYDTDENSPTWMTDGIKITLKKKETRHLGSDGAAGNGIRERVDRRVGNDLCVSDLAYIASVDVLCILRNDLCIEFLKFSSRAKVHPDFIMHFGMINLPHGCLKIAVRDIGKEPLRLFAVNTSTVIDSWVMEVGNIGPVKFKDHQQLVDQHTDYIRDILIIHCELYSLIVSGGMDKAVHIWDLVSLKHRTKRTGLSAGVNCLAFDGGSLLFAGGFDYQIIAWDLDAHINKPLFALHGHTSTVTRIVALSQNSRCMSLGDDGVVNFWDISKFSAADSTERCIDSTAVGEDRLRSIDVIIRGNGMYQTMHGLILVAHGNSQHVYRIKDTCPKESAPLCVLYSSRLAMLVTCHTHDLVFRSVWSGEEQCKQSYSSGSGGIGGGGGDILVAITDDRGRKVIVGGSSGVISEYNMLTGAPLKSFPPLPGALRLLSYSPDKTVIAIAGSGDLFILDDSTNDEVAVDCLMREVRAHDNDVVGLAYSHMLGLIATADCTGRVHIWDYQYLSLDLAIDNFTPSGEIAQLSFLEPYPLLLIADHFHRFYVVPVGKKAVKKYGKVIWMLNPLANALKSSKALFKPMTLDDMLNSKSKQLTVTELEHGSLQKSTSEFDESATGSIAADDDSVTVGSSIESDGGDNSGDDEEETQNTRKPFNPRRTQRYLANRVEVKSLVVFARDNTNRRERHQLHHHHHHHHEHGHHQHHSHDQHSNHRSAEVTTSTVMMTTDLAGGNITSTSAATVSTTVTTAAAAVVVTDGDSSKSKTAGEDAKHNSQTTENGSRLQLQTGDQPRGDAAPRPRPGTGSRPGTGAQNDEDDEDEYNITSTQKQFKWYSDSFLLNGVTDRPCETIESLNAAEDSIENDEYFSYFVVTGHEDGTIATFDISLALLAIGIPPLSAREIVPNGDHYDPHKMVTFRQLKQQEIERVAFTPQDLCAVCPGYTYAGVHTPEEVRVLLRADGSMAGALVDCAVVGVWQAHKSNVVALTPGIGDYDEFLSVSDDGCAHMYTLNGNMKGVLTRGRDVDKLFTCHWKNPVNMRLRHQVRLKKAISIIDEMGLKFTPPDKSKLSDFFDPFTSDGLPEKIRRQRLREHELMLTSSLAPQLKAATTSATTSGTNKHHAVKNKHGHSGGHHLHPHSGGTSDLHDTGTDLSETIGGMGPDFDPEDPDTLRLLGQLRGKVNYKLNQAEVAASTGGGLHMTGSLLAPTTTRGKKKEKSEKKSKSYLNDLMQDDGGAAIQKDQQQPIPSEHDSKQRNIKSKFDVEIEEMERADPNNWNIASSNRQRALYQKMYVEIDKYRASNRIDAMFEHKLNQLCPGGNFKEFSTKLKKGQKAARTSRHNNNNKTQNSYHTSTTAATDTQAAPSQAVETDLTLDKVVADGNDGTGIINTPEEKGHGVYGAATAAGDDDDVVGYDTTTVIQQQPQQQPQQLAAGGLIPQQESEMTLTVLSDDDHSTGFVTYSPFSPHKSAPLTATKRTTRDPSGAAAAASPTLSANKQQSHRQQQPLKSSSSTPQLPVISSAQPKPTTSLMPHKHSRPSLTASVKRERAELVFPCALDTKRAGEARADVESALKKFEDELKANEKVSRIANRRMKAVKRERKMNKKKNENEKGSLQQWTDGTAINPLNVDGSLTIELPKLRHTASQVLLEQRTRDAGASFGAHEEIAERIMTIQRNMERKMGVAQDHHNTTAIRRTAYAISDRSEAAKEAAAFVDSAMGTSVAAAVMSFMKNANNAKQVSEEEVRAEIEEIAQASLLVASSSRRASSSSLSKHASMYSRIASHKPLKAIAEPTESDLIKRDKDGKIDYKAAAAQVAWRNVGVVPVANSQNQRAAAAVRGDASSFLVNARDDEHESGLEWTEADDIEYAASQEQLLYSTLGEWHEYRDYLETLPPAGSKELANIEADQTHMSLIKILEHPAIQARSKFTVVLLRLLQYKSTHYHIMKQQVTVTLGEVLFFLKPFMTVGEQKKGASVLSSLLEKEFLEEEHKRHFVSLEELGRLKSLFDLFDPEHSGEVRLATLMKYSHTGGMDGLEDDADEEARDVARSMMGSKPSSSDQQHDHNFLDEDTLKRIIDSVDFDHNHCLSFNEFVELFKNTDV